MAVVNDEPLGSSGQDVVVIIEPTSQHGARGDTVTIITSTLVDDEVVQLTERREVFEEDSNFHLQLVVPVRGTTLAKDAPWSAAVLLPRTTRGYEVELVEFGGEVEAQLFTPDVENPRRIVVWHGVQDPALDVLWKYLTLK
jgi:hypothetical protein